MLLQIYPSPCVLLKSTLPLYAIIWKLNSLNALPSIPQQNHYSGCNCCSTKVKISLFRGSLVYERPWVLVRTVDFPTLFFPFLLTFCTFVIIFFWKKISREKIKKREKFKGRKIWKKKILRNKLKKMMRKFFTFKTKKLR